MYSLSEYLVKGNCHLRKLKKLKNHANKNNYNYFLSYNF